MQEQTKYKIHYSKQSQRDLDEIWDYIETELQNPSAAGRIVGEIMDSIDRLADFAEMGAPLSSITSAEEDYRFLVNGSYLTFYRVSDREVNVDRILYGRRDYLHVLFENAQEKTRG
ncbi:MAG: type II toxin-antitoxin system RelE/ParE family toxin [Bacillota bacterium]|nr:type II toxin-antitoxin system RelE/ParE family toxin [Bacillota bacterium]